MRCGLRVSGPARCPKSANRAVIFRKAGGYTGHACIAASLVNTLDR